MNREIIKKYLENEAFVLDVYYKKIQAKELGISEGDFSGSIPTPQEIKVKFNKWLNLNKVLLKQKICVEWNYTEIRKKHIYDIEIAILLGEQLSKFTDFPYEIAAILILNGLDTFCES